MNLPKFIITLDGVLRLGEKSRSNNAMDAAPSCFLDVSILCDKALRGL